MGGGGIGSADTSSYPKATMPVSPLDMAQKFGALQQQSLSINQQKLDQANQGLTYMTRAMGALGPNAPKEAYIKAASDDVKLGLVPEQQLQVFVDKAQSAPTSKAFYDEFMTTAADHQQQIQYHMGTNANLTDNANIYSGVQRPVSQGGGFVPATQTPIQPPPTQPNVNNQRLLPNGKPNPNYLQPGIVGATAPPGVYPARPGDLPVAPLNNAPAAPAAVPIPQPRPSLPTTGPTGPTVQTGYNFNQRFAGGPIVTGAPPGVAEAIGSVGKQSGVDYAADLSRAKNYQADLYPMTKVLDILKEEGPQAFGPGTPALNNVKSAIATWLPNVDPKVIESVSNFEQAKKYLVQAARVAGNTGTNDQLAAAFEANPNVTMNGATIDTVVKSNIALRKMQHAQTLLFGQQNLPVSEYSQWISKNQNVLDPRAFGFDMMGPEAKTKFMNTIATQDKTGNWIAKKDKKKEFDKFEQSLSFANDAGLIEPPGRK